MNASAARRPALARTLLVSLALLAQSVGARADEPKSGNTSGHVERVNAVVFSPDGQILATGGGDPAYGGHDRSVKLWDPDGNVLATLEGHAGPVLSVAFSPDGKTLASAGADKVVKLWDVAARKELATLEGHADTVVSLAFAPDGKTLASASRDATVRLWDVATRQTRLVLKGHASQVQDVAFSPDSRILASSGADMTVKLWDVASGRELRTLKGHGFGVWSVAFAPDGKTLATAGMDETARIWDVATGQERQKLDLSGRGYAVAYSPDGKTLAVAIGGPPFGGPEPAVVGLWDTSTWKETRTLVGHLEAIQNLAFSPDGKTLASASSDRTVRLWDLSTGALRLTFKRATHPGTEDLVFMAHLKPIRSVAYAPDGQTVATAGEDGSVKLWVPATRIDRAILHGHVGKVLGLAYAPDGKTLASAGEDGTVRTWNPETGRELAVLRGHTGNVFALAFSPDGKTLASGGEDATIRLWDVAAGKPKAILARHTSSVLALAFSPDGKTLASSSTDQTERLWDVATGRVRETLEGHTQPVVCLAFAPSDPNTLATASPDGTVILWDVAEAKPRATIRGHVGRILSLAFAPDGKTMATAGDDGAIRRWDVATGRLVGMRSMLSQSPIVALAYSPDGRVLAAGDQGRRMRLWDVNVWLTSLPFSGHNQRVNVLRMSADGKTLVSGGTDNSLRVHEVPDGLERLSLVTEGPVITLAITPDARTMASVSNTTDAMGGSVVRLWDVTTGKEQPPLLGDTSNTQAIAISPDGKTLASGGAGRVVSIWDLATHKPLQQLEGHTGVVMALAFSPDGKTLASGGYDTNIKLWDPARGTLRTTLKSHTKSITTLAFSPDGRVLASGGLDRAVILWDMPAGRERARLVWQRQRITGLAFSPDGRMLGATAGLSTSICFWNVATAQRRLVLKMPTERTPDTFDSMVFSPDGLRLYTGSIKDILPWNVSDVSPHVKYFQPLPAQSLATFSGHRDVVLSARFTADGRTLASLSEDGSVKLWDIASRRERATLGGSAYWSRCLALAPDGKTLATGVGPPILNFAEPPTDTGLPLGQKVKLWDVATAREKAAFHNESESDPDTVDISFDGRFLAASDREGNTLWDLLTQKRQFRLANDQRLVDDRVTFSPNGKTLATRPSYQEVRLCDVATGRQQIALPHSDYIHSFCFSPDGKTLATKVGQYQPKHVWTDGYVALWDVATGRPKTTLRGLTGTAAPMAFSPDSRVLATGDQGNQVLLWDTTTGAVRATFSGHKKKVNLLAFSPDGSRLASTAFDDTVKIWDIAEGRELASYLGHDDVVEWIEFSPDGKLLATAGRDNTVMLWDAHPRSAGVPHLDAKAPAERIVSKPATPAKGVPYRLGVNVYCSATSEDGRAGKAEDVSIIATVAKPGHAIENRRTRKFPVAGTEGASGSFVTGVADGDVAPGESVHVFLTFTEQDDGLPPAFLDLLAKAGAKATGQDAVDPATSLVNALAGAFHGFPKDSDDILGIIAVKLTCTVKGELMMETRPIYEAVEAAPHRLRDAAEEAPRYHRHELSGAGGRYEVVSWVCYTQPPPPSTKARIEYMSHVAGIGDTEFVRQAETTGSARESRAMEGLAIRLATGSEAIDLRVKAHVAFHGDTDWVGLGGFVGTRGASLPMEALWMELKGTAAEKYDVCYSVRIAGCDWMGWVKNGSQAGSTGFSKPIEALRVYIAEKPQ